MGVRAYKYNYNYYKLLKDIPALDAGAIFYWDKDDAINGSVAEGCLKLCLTEHGSCYGSKDNCGFCGDTFILHASTRHCTDWFELVQEEIPIVIEEEIIDMTIEEIEDALGCKINIVKDNTTLKK